MPEWLTHLGSAIGAIGGWKILEKLLEKWGPWAKDDATHITIEQAPLPDYKNTFLEKIGTLMEAQTSAINKILIKFDRYDDVILAKDENLIPRPWQSPILTKMLQRTHENVGIIGEAVGENTAMLAQISKKVGA